MKSKTKTILIFAAILAAVFLIAFFDGGAVYFNEARLVIICKKLYLQQMKEECFTDKEPLRWYDNDLHNIVIGKIEKVLVKE